MKKIVLGTSCAAVMLLSGCASHPTMGALYSEIKAPISATANSSGMKTGESDECTSILGLVATGDCSVENAKHNGNITEVSTIDYQSKNLLGIIHKGRTIVTGR